MDKDSLEFGYMERPNLLKERIIFINGEITDKLSQLIIEQLLYLDAKNNNDITMYINSPGGSVIHGLAIYDTMNYIKSNIVTICVGMCASMGAVLLSSGTKGKRYILPNSEVMIHETSSGTMGTVSNMKIDLEHTIKINNKIIEILAKNTNKDIKQIQQDINKDYWLDSSEAVSYGLIDKVITS